MSTLSRLRVPLSQILGYLLLGVSAAIGSHWPEAWGVVFTGVSVALVMLACFGRIWCSLFIGGYKNGMLVTEGPYSLCRHPLYLCSLVGALGVGLATRTFTVPAVIGIAFASYYPAVMREEEAQLEMAHGQPYRRYRVVTSAFLPRRRDLREPETYPVRPAAFRRDVGHAVWFVVALIAVATLAELHARGILPFLKRLV